MKQFDSQYFEFILESLPHPFYVIDASNRLIIFANQAAKAIGVRVNAPCYALTHQSATPCDGRAHPCPLLIVKESKKPVIVEHIHCDLVGNQRYTEVYGYPILDPQGEVVQMIEYSVDITARKTAEKALNKTNEVYQRFVPREFLTHLGVKEITEVALGQHIQREMTVLFSDIRSFTTLVEEMTPEESFKFVNTFMNIMGPIIRKNRGFIDKYIGDAIMALFGTGPEDAVDAAIAIHETLVAYNEDRTRIGCFPLKVGVGINTGLLMLGVIGESGRMEETVIGDAVNLTSRIEGLTKVYGVAILISQSALSSMKNPERYLTRFIDWVQVKGKANPLPIYEIFDADPPILRRKKQDTLHTFQEAIAQYHLGQIDQAMKLFKKCVAINPEDRAAAVYLQKCQDVIAGGTTAPGALMSNRSWSEALAIDHDTIDQQHQELFRQINLLIDSIKAGHEAVDIPGLIHFLNDYIIEHFAAEEKIMATFGFPCLAYHHELHHKFIQDFQEIRKDTLSEKGTLAYRVVRIQLLVMDWLTNHINSQDKQFAKYLRTCRAAGSE